MSCISDLINDGPCDCRAFIFEDILKGKLKVKMSLSGSETVFSEEEVVQVSSETNFSGSLNDTRSKSNAVDFGIVIEEKLGPVYQLLKRIEEKVDRLETSMEQVKEVQFQYSAADKTDNCASESLLDPSTSNDLPSSQFGLPFAFACIDKETIPVILPSFVEFAIRATKCRSTVVSLLLRHFHTVKFLRNHTLTGASKRLNEDGSVVEALPTTTVESIIAVVQKISPPETLNSYTEGSPDYKSIMKTDATAIRGLITRAIQYFRYEYDESGCLKKRKKSKKVSSLNGSSEDS